MKQAMFKMMLTLGLVAGFAATAAAGIQTKKYNVLMIVSDDLTPRLGHLGFGHVRSPHLDKLASQGVSFEKAYCQYPLCGPSRASLMTGRRPDGTRVYGNNTHIRENLPDVVTMGQMFRQAGYFSGRVGKIFHYGVPGEIGTDGSGDDQKTWNERVNPAGRDIDDEYSITNYMPKKTKLTETRPRLGAALSWRADDGGDLVQTDGKVALETIKMIEARKGQPFFIACGFYRPHVPDVAPKEYWSHYPLENIRLPSEPADVNARVPALALYVKQPNYGIAADDLRRFLQAYYASVTFMDNQVGRVLEALDRNNLRDNTIVVFFSDHGWLLGEHGGQWQKMSLFEWSARVPLIVSVPGSGGKGQRSPRTVELVDIYPTLADLCGITPPSGLDGESFRPLLEEPAARWDHPAFTQVSRGMAVAIDAPKQPGGRRAPAGGRSIRTDRYRYTLWTGPGGGEELYDHDADRGEYNNLADDPKLATIKAQLRGRLEQTLKADAAPPDRAANKAVNKAANAAVKR